MGAIARRIDLRKHVEHVRQHVGRNADAGVGHRDGGHAAVHRRSHADLTAARRVLRCVGQHVREHLLEPRRVGVRPHRPIRQVDGERVAVRVDGRPDRLNRAVQHRAEIDPAPPQLQFVLDDARHVEQVVGEPHEVDQLALDGRARLVDDRAVVARDPHDFERRPHRRERRAQFVRQRRQELVFPPVRLEQRLLGPAPFGQVDAHADAAVNVPLRVVKRLHVVLHVQHGAIGADDIDLVADGRAMGDRVLHRQLGRRKVLAVPLYAIRRLLAGRRRQRDIGLLGELKQRRQRPIRGDDAAFGIVCNRNRNRRTGDDRTQGVQALPKLVDRERIEAVERAPFSHGESGGRFTTVLLFILMDDAAAVFTLPRRAVRRCRRRPRGRGRTPSRGCA